jgi:WhiB family redox-sensing transcriptional regulator
MSAAWPPAWMDAAACARPGADPEAWFPERGAWGPANTAAVQACEVCPVRAVCLAYALERGMRYGIWGGLTERQRRRVVRGRAA